MRKLLTCLFVVSVVILLTCPLGMADEQMRPPAGKEGGHGKRPTGQRGNGNRTALTGSAVKVINGEQNPTELPELSVQSTKADESALRVQDGANVVIERLTINKRGDASSEEDSNFFSLNASVAVWKGASLTVNGGLVESAAKGANAFVAYGKDASIKVQNLEIRTTANSSRGLHATYGGRIEGDHLKITTQGAHCAALATDRGGGMVIGRNINAVTHGNGSPGIYSTGNITAIDSSFDATGSEAAVIEGKNSITVHNCTMVGHKRCGAMLYQSFSGDADVGTSVFAMEGGSLTSKTGPVFFITNTNAKAKISNAKLVPANGVLVEGGSDRWGRTGRNGGHFTLQAESQALDGDIVVNDISDVTLILGQGAKLNGATNVKATAGKVNMELGDGAIWNVTADSSVDSLSFAGDTVDDLRKRIVSNGHVIHYREKKGILNGEKISLDNGGMLVYTPAPKVAVQTSDDNQKRGGDRDGRRRPGPPPDGFGGGHRRGGPPSDGFGGKHRRGGPPPDDF